MTEPTTTYVFQCSCSQCGDEETPYPTFPIQSVSVLQAREVALLICSKPVMFVPHNPS
jgi:hypothetical protein